jgi:hypothetical protein
MAYNVFNRSRMQPQMAVPGGSMRQGIVNPSRMGPPQIGVDSGSMRQGIVSAPTMREALMQTQPQQGVAEILSQGMPEMMPDLGGATSAASRQRQIADMLLQGAQSQDNTSIAGGLSQLGQAFLARKAGQKADTAEDKQREMASLLMQQAMQGGEQGQASLQQLLTQNPDAAMQYLIQANAPKPPPEAYTLGEGQRRYVGDQMIAEVPKPTEAPKYEKVSLADGEYEYIPGQPESLRKVGDSPVKSPLVDITMPGDGPAPVGPFQEAVDKAAADEYIAWTTGGGSDAMKQLTQLQGVQADLESGKSLTGPLLGMVSPETRTLFNQGSVDAQQLVEEVVQRNLRLILGAQFTAKEGDLLIARAYNPRLDEELNSKRLASLVKQISVAAQQKQAMMDHLEQYGTMVGFTGKTPSIQQFFDVLAEGEGGINAPRKRRWDSEAGRMVDAE